jgi:hypothetical protein
MTLKRETVEPTEPPDAGNGNQPHSSSGNLRRRIIAVFGLVLGALMFALYEYDQSTYLGSTNWRWFWIKTVSIWIWFVFGIVQVIRGRLKL